MTIHQRLVRLALLLAALVGLAGLGAVVGSLFGEPWLGGVVALVTGLILGLPALVLPHKADSRLSLRGFYLMFRGGRG